MTTEIKEKKDKDVLLEQPKEPPKDNEEFQRRLALFNKELELVQKKYELKIVARLLMAPDAIIAQSQVLDLKGQPKPKN
jgi:hypothetical protein